MGIMYWMVPHLTGRRLWSRGVALAQAWSWFIGMALFSRGLHALGILGAPRRTMLGIARENYGTEEWDLLLLMAGVGGCILGLSFLLFLFNIVMTAFFSKEKVEVEMPIAEPAAVELAPGWLLNWKPWLVGTFALIVIAYGPMLFKLIQEMQATSPGFNVWQ